MNKSSNQSKLTAQQYRFVSEMIWGGVPVERDWAEDTAIFKNSVDRILKEYPMLDKSIKGINEIRNMEPDAKQVLE